MRRETVVIGGGAVGLFCAWRLARRGAAVTLIEPRSLAKVDTTAASWAAAGMLGAASETLLEEPRAPRLRLGRAALRAWAAAIDALDTPLVETCGALVLGDTPERAAALDGLAADASALGLSVASVDARDLGGRWPGLSPVARSLAFADEGVVDIAAALGALAAQLEMLGVPVIHDEAVAVRSRGNDLVVETRAGRGLRADHVVAAPGLTSVAALRDSVPVLGRLGAMKGQMAMLDAPAPTVVRARDVYLAPRGNRVVIGATMEPGRTDVAVDDAVIARLVAAARRVAPHLAGAPVVAAWAGVRPMSPDGLPFVGPSGPAGCLVAAGHSRNGWLLAPLTADLISSYVFDEDIPDIAAMLQPDRS